MRLNHRREGNKRTESGRDMDSHRLILNLEVAVWLRTEIALIVVMYPYETVFTSRSVARALGVYRNPKTRNVNKRLVDKGYRREGRKRHTC